MIYVESEVKGLAEMGKFMHGLGDEVERKMLQGALLKAANPIVTQAQQNVANLFGGSSRYTGTLEAGITRGSTRKTGLAARVNVKLKKGRTKEKRKINGVWKEHGLDPFYGRFLELGTSKMTAKPWLKPAAMTKQGEAGREMNAALQKQIALWCKRNGVKFQPSGV